MNQVVCLLYPKIIGFKNRLSIQDRSVIIKLTLGITLGLCFWAGIFAVFYRVLVYLKGIEALGDILAAKLLSMVFITFLSLLIFSNIITALSAFFMSEELQLIISSPVDYASLYFTKLLETMVNSSWMVLLFSLPVFLSYGIAYQQHIAYYCVLIGTMIPFIIIGAVLGTGIALGLTMVFPAKRIKDIMILLSLILGIALYCLFRYVQPEKLVDPESFRTVVEYFASMEAPTSAFLPSQWATDAIAALLFRGHDGALFNLLLLWSTGLAGMVLLQRLFGKVYFAAWTKSQDASSAKLTRHTMVKRMMDRTLTKLTASSRAVVTKDLYCFMRDSSQWSQLFVLSAIIFIYLYNFSVLPLEKSPFPTIYLQNFISFLNLGLAGFTLAAVAVRFAFPAISIEGESFWIIKAAPLDLRRFMWCKFWLNFAFLLVLAESLIICSNYLLRVGSFMMLVSIVTIALMTFGITSLSIGCGAIYPRFDVENKAQIPTGFGGLIYMILAIVFIGIVIVLEAGPVYMVLMAQLRRASLQPIQWIKIIISFAAVAAINVLVFYLPMKIGIRKLSALEKF
jgi:ABC-2 type transport system permease protein